MDIKAREWGEVTNNMWANNAYIKNGLNDRVQYDKLYKYLAPEKSLKTYEELDYSEKLGMFWQLQIKKNTYWAELEALYRKRKPKNLSGGQRQRVALGRAIVRNQKVFLMDLNYQINVKID